MITKNYKNHIYCILACRNDSNAKGMLPIRAYNNTVYYDNGYGYSSFPNNISTNLVTSASSTGIMVGTGTTAPTEDDYKLESQITSGISSSVNRDNGMDSNGNPYVQYDITITNTSSSSITISEIGYQQKIYATTTQGGTSASDRTCLFDRTVLDEPVTIPSGSYGVIRYTLKTIVPSED